MVSFIIAFISIVIIFAAFAVARIAIDSDSRNAEQKRNVEQKVGLYQDIEKLERKVWSLENQLFEAKVRAMQRDLQTPQDTTKAFDTDSK